MSSPSRLKLQSRIALAVLVIGLALMAFKIYADSEPGALPLALVLAGTIWLSVSRYRLRQLR